MENEWVIILLIYADFRQEDGIIGIVNKELQDEYRSLMRDLKTCNLQEEIKIILVENIIMPDSLGRIKSDRITVSFLKKAGHNKNKKVEIKKTTTPTKDPLQKKDYIGKILYNIDNNQYPDAGITKGKRYCLITWDHGSAFGIFKRLEQEGVVKEMAAIRFQSVSVNLNNNTNNFTHLNVNQGGFSRVKNVDGSYELVERATGKGIMHFFSPQNKFLFAVKPEDDLWHFATAILSDPDVSCSLKLNLSKESLQILPDEEKPNSLQATFEKSKHWPLIEKSDFLCQSVMANKIELKSFTTAVSEFKMIDILTNEELDEAIVLGLGIDGKIDVLIMMNCYMMNVMACYALKDHVKYLVAPQGTISEPGYNYKAILKQISNSIANNSVIEADDLAKLCVHTCGYEAGISKRQKFKHKIDQWDVMAMSLKDYDAIANAIDAIAQICIAIFTKNNGDDPDYVFNYVRCLCCIYNDMSLSYEMVDIGYWLTELIFKLQETNVDVQDLLTQHLIIDKMLNKHILAKRNSDRISSFNYEVMQLFQRQATGVCLYFPSVVSKDDDTFTFFIDGGGSDRARFISDKKNWLNLLNSYFSG